MAASWSFSEDKEFENMIAVLDLDGADWLERLAAGIPTKSVEEVRDHYLDLISDVDLIDSGLYEGHHYSAEGELGFPKDINSNSSASAEVAAAEEAAKEEEMMFDVETGLTLAELEEVMALLGEEEEGAEKEAGGTSSSEAAAAAALAARKRVVKAAASTTKGKSWTEEEHRFVEFAWCNFYILRFQYFGIYKNSVYIDRSFLDLLILFLLFLEGSSAKSAARSFSNFPFRDHHDMNSSIFNHASELNYEIRT